MKSYIVDLTCPSCGCGDLDHVNGTVRSTEAVAVARCRECRDEWVVRVWLAPLETPEQRRAREKAARRNERRRAERAVAV